MAGSSSQVKIFITAIVMGIVAIISVESHIIMKITAFRCESFGCIALGMFYVGIGVLLPIIFAITTVFVVKADRRRAFLTALLAGYLAMFGAASILNILNKIRIQDGYRKAAEACEEYPQLCQPESE